MNVKSSLTQADSSPSACLPESEVTWSGRGKVFTPAAPFGLDLGWTEVTVSRTGAARGELNPEDVGAGAEAELELEAAGGGFVLLLLLAELSLRLRSDQSGHGK